MDATRTFETNKTITDNETQDLGKTMEEIEAMEADKRIAAGCGYGSKHPTYHRYYSQNNPSHPIPEPDSHPALFPTSTLVFPTRKPLNAMTPEEKEQSEREWRKSAAAGLGFGRKNAKYFQYLSQALVLDNFSH
jgi:hypothetical protein